ncbi:hypothetical protein ACQY0O_002030 [Thecaphora frezii]
MQKIVLYDIPGYATPEMAWSPDTWMVRFVLNMKKLDYRTVWVEGPDVRALYRSLDLKPNGNVGYGQPRFSLPVIHDPNTGVVLSGAFDIPLYLEEAYGPRDASQTPMLFPRATVALQREFCLVWLERIAEPLYRLTSAAAAAQLPPRSRAFYRQRWRHRYGVPPEEVAPPGSARRRSSWYAVRCHLTVLHYWISLSGDAFASTFAMVFVASYLTWIKRLLGAESDEWKQLVSPYTDEGRWRDVAAFMAPYEHVDAESLEQPFWRPKTPSQEALVERIRETGQNDGSGNNDGEDEDDSIGWDSGSGSSDDDGASVDSTAAPPTGDWMEVQLTRPSDVEGA